MSQRGYLHSIDADANDETNEVRAESEFSEEDAKKSKKLTGAPKHNTERSHPYEHPQLPIEQIEKKIKVQDLLVKEQKEGDKKDKQEDEIKYQKISIEGEDMCGVPLEDLAAASKLLVEALQMREKYMTVSQQSFATTAKKFLETYKAVQAESTSQTADKSSLICKDCKIPVQR